MAGVSDAPFRRLCRRFGAGMTTSEMTTADIGLWKTAKSRRRLDLDMDATPRVVQIAGSDPAQLALAARLCVERGAHIIDINMGCPAKKVCKQLAGSALLKDPLLVDANTRRRGGRRRCARYAENAHRVGHGSSQRGRDCQDRRGAAVSRRWQYTGARALVATTGRQNMKRSRASKLRSNSDYRERRYH